MNCQQKSGVLLSASCKNPATGRNCQRCQKSICTVHTYHCGNKQLCESCYWTTYLQGADPLPKKRDDGDTYTGYDDPNGRDNSSFGLIYFPGAGSRSEREEHSSADEAEAHEFSFGGGLTGGGGAGGGWDESDLDSFDLKDSLSIEDLDDTFYYS